MHLLARYRKLTFWNKLAAWGSIVSLVAFVVWIINLVPGILRERENKAWRDTDRDTNEVVRRIERLVSTPDSPIDSLEGFDESDRAAIESARLRWRRGDASGAIASLDSVSAKYQQFLVSLFIVRGAARVKSGDILTASVEFRRAVAVDSTSARAHLNLGGSLARSSPEEALRELDEALRLQPHYVPALVTRGSVLIILGRPHDAIPDLERATQLQPSGSAWEVLATARGMAGDLEGMKRTWEKARTHNPQSARAWFNVAITHYNEGNIPIAVAFADSALARAPDSPDLPAQILAFRAHALERQGRLQETK